MRRRGSVNFALETAAGKLALAEADMRMGMAGAAERHKLCLEEYERMRAVPVIYRKRDGNDEDG